MSLRLSRALCRGCGSDDLDVGRCESVGGAEFEMLGELIIAWLAEDDGNREGDRIAPRSAVDSCPESPTGFCQTERVERCQSIDQVGLRDDSKIVETGCTVSRHPVLGAQRQFGRNTPDRSRHGYGQHVVQDRNSGGPSHHKERSPPDVFDLAPPHLASARLAYQGSSRIASRREATAASRSASVTGFRR